MLTVEQNELVTRSGRGTPAGELLRRYWQPAALTEELAGERPILPVRLLGEDLVLFRDEAGAYGLLHRHCRHRGADLCFGRLEDGGLRCAFHGWLFDVDGKCLEQPAEPAGSRFHAKVRQPSYPCRERNGIVFAYMGPGEPAALPAYDCFVAPDTFSFAFKGLYECNWLQALEVGIDPAHASFLHRFFEDEDPDKGYGQQFRGGSDRADMPQTKVLREFDRPRLEVAETEYGLRIFALRELDEARTHIRVTNLAFPNAITVPMSANMILTQWHVPIDDTHSWWYTMFTDYREHVDKETMRAQRLASCTLPDYRPLRNRANNYGFDAREQKTRTYTGMGMDINVHDQWAVESPGLIQDRTVEHLGATDKAITAYRRMLLRALAGIERGEDPPTLGKDAESGRHCGPIAIDTIGPAESWQECWMERDRTRREESAWAADPC